MISSNYRPGGPLWIKASSKMGLWPLVDIIVVCPSALCTLQTCVFGQEKRPKMAIFRFNLQVSGYHHLT